MKKLFIIISLSLSSLLVHAEGATRLDTIYVRETSNKLVDFVPSVSKISGKDLRKKRQTSLGDTLQAEPGVNSTTFGPSASRPVVRGLDGDRIRVLQNGLGSLDASTQSVDHAIPIDTLLIEQIELVRGPMSLLYGSSTIGGVVNIMTNRIPTKFSPGVSGKFLSQAESVNHGLSNSGQVNYGKNNLVIHADASTRNLSDQRIPGYARTEGRRHTTPLPSGDNEPNGKLPNSFNKQNSQALGTTKFFDQGHLGVSFNHFHTNYGTVAEKNVAVDMKQKRWDLNGEYRPPSFMFDTIKIKSAQSDYNHREKTLGVVGTTFKNNGNETRIDAISKYHDIEGVSGVQSQVFNFSALGSEAFLPPAKNQKLAIFTFQEYKKDQHTYNLSLRLEDNQLRKKYSENFGIDDKKTYLNRNAALGYQFSLDQKNQFSTHFSYTERAPTFQELYSRGGHVAVAIYEQGDVTLKQEKSESLEFNYKNISDKNNFTANIFGQRFDNFISLNPTNTTDAGTGFLIYNYRQVGAVLYGTDLEDRLKVLETEKGVWTLISKFDYVRIKETSSNQNIPRISPARLSLGMEYLREKWSADLEVQHVFEQRDVALFETKTAGYTLTNLGYNYQLTNEKMNASLFFRLRNIFNVEARNHVSTLKEVSPLPGRNAILGAQIDL